MLNGALWNWFRDPRSRRDLPSLIQEYQQTHDIDILVSILKKVDGSEGKLYDLISNILGPHELNDFLNHYIVISERRPKGLKTAEIESNIEGFIYISIKRACLSYLKDTKATSISTISLDDMDFDDPILTDDSSPVDAEMEWEEYLTTCKAVLSPKQWEAFQKTRLEGKTFQVTAEEMDATIGQVRGYVFHAVKKLKDTFGN